MIRSFRLIGLVAAAVALALVPATAVAKNDGTSGKSCDAKNKAFVVKGTFVSSTADSVTLTVTRANRHARRSGELVDTDAGTEGTQVTYSSASDDYTLKLSGYDGDTDTPSPGDKVRVKGKIAYTKKRCAPEGTSVEDRYGDVNVKRVKLIDKD